MKKIIKYKIFVIYHDEINISYYDKSVIDNLVFVNVNKNNHKVFKGVKIISLYEIDNFISLGKWYTESEVIYNVYKNDFLIGDADYIGFVHYDIDLNPITDEFIQDCFNTNINTINLQSYLFKDDYKQKILMDVTQPNTLRGEGKNCYITIFDDYNSHYKTKHSIESYIENANINLCSSFVINKTDFYSMMEFISLIIESKKLDCFDTEHKYRIQGGFMERYFAVWVLLRGEKSINLKLKHDFVETNKQLPIFKRLKSWIAKRIK